MGKNKDSGKKKGYAICFAILWLLQMAAAFWFCTQKQGFHEDEFYTYYSTARTNGFYVEDGKWMGRDAYCNEFVVLPEERFQYGLVKQVQSWDVHPPMYYWVFHTAASFVPGVFSKWTGLSVNLLFHGISLMLLTYLSYLVCGKDERLPLFVLFVYGFCPAAMSGVVFIRMYEMLTTFVLLCAVLHVRAVLGKGGGGRIPARTLFAMAAVTYVGFLTQYYYFIFLFFLAIGFCAWLLWRDRNIWNCARYGLFQGLAFVLAYLTYPAFPGQMFKGQRGAQATQNFFDLSNTFERLGFFWDLMNRYVFGGLLGLMVLLLLAVAAVMRIQNGRRAEKSGARECRAGAAFYMLLFAAVGYFAAVSKTALLLGDTSNRYQLPVYGIAALLVFLAGKEMWERAVNAASRQEGKEAERPSVRWVRCLGAAAVCLGIVVLGYVRADVVFLYPEKRAQADWAAERAEEHTPVVYIYRPGEEWCVWDAADELFAYEEVLFVSADSVMPIVDDRIQSADSLVVYLAKGAVPKEQFDRLSTKDGAPVQNGVQLMFAEKYCDVYDLRR